MQPIVETLSIGLPAPHGADHISDKPWTSGIFKAATLEPVWLDTLNLAGDGQDDLDNHGGPFRAVLAYAADHYSVWRAELPRVSLEHGSFGENLTVSGVDETTVCIGDVYQLGEARLQVTQPRQPCWKLARRVGYRQMTAHVHARGWGGWYHRVLTTGYIRAGDRYELVERVHPEFTIARLNDLAADRESDAHAYRILSTFDMLTPSWREWFASKAVDAADAAEA